MKNTIEETTRLMLNGTLPKEEADKILLALHNVSNSALPNIYEFATKNFENIAKMAQRLTTGNVSHLGKTIDGVAKRSAEFIKKYY